MRIIVKSIDQMPGEARGGIPLGCVLEADHGQYRVVAYGKGSTWSGAGLNICAPTMNEYEAIFSHGAGPEEDEGESLIELQATDIQAALQWVEEHFIGPFSLYVVQPRAIFLGEFSQTGSQL